MRRDLIIPETALSQHIAVLGKTGSGKTNTAKWLVEQHVAAGARVCVLDPIKSDWWGLTSSATGKSAGLPFSILGGPKQHAPLPARSGTIIGTLVASGELPLSIIDMADFTPREMSAWYLEFAETLFRKMAGVLILVMEEADIFAPKEMLGNKGGENMRLHWSSRLGRAGRSKGIRLVMNCTRVQKIHNDMLGSCETLVAHRFTTPADRKPIIEWLSVNAEKSIVKEIECSLSSLKNGEGWVCYPEGGHIQGTQFPRITTYDNSKTPAHGDSAAQVKTAAIDIDALKGKLGDAVKEVEANDPALLRKRISELERQASAKPKSAVDQAATEKAVAAAIVSRDKEWQSRIKERESIIDSLKGRIVKAASILSVNGEATPKMGPPEVRKSAAVVAATTERQLPVPAERPRPSGKSGLPVGEAAILSALIQFPDGLEREQLSVLAGYAKSSRDAYIYRLREKGFVDVVAGGRIVSTEAGIAALPDSRPLPTGEELQRYWLDRLPKGEAEILQHLINSHPKPVEKSSLDDVTGFAKSSRDAYLYRLRAKQLVEEPGRGEVKASNNLF